MNWLLNLLGIDALKRQNSLIFKVKSQTVSKLYLYSDRDISENNYDKNNEGSYLSFVTNGEFYFNKKGSHFLFNKHYEIHVKWKYEIRLLVVTSSPGPSRPVPAFLACPIVPLSQDKEETSVPLSRKVALSRPVGNPSYY